MRSVGAAPTECQGRGLPRRRPARAGLGRLLGPQAAAVRGMGIAPLCTSEGPGLRGLVGRNDWRWRAQRRGRLAIIQKWPAHPFGRAGATKPDLRIIEIEIEIEIEIGIGIAIETRPTVFAGETIEPAQHHRELQADRYAWLDGIRPSSVSRPDFDTDFDSDLDGHLACRCLRPMRRGCARRTGNTDRWRCRCYTHRTAVSVCRVKNLRICLVFLEPRPSKLAPVRYNIPRSRRQSAMTRAA